MPEANLDGRIFVVTGGTQGLGEATARCLARRGAEGIAFCGRNRERGALVASELEALGCATLYVPADLSLAEDCRQVIQSCGAHFGALHGLVNVAASTARGGLEDTSAEAWDEIFALNVRAPFLLMQEAVALMKRTGKGGSIVNVSSVSAYGGQPYLTAYCTSKAALDALTKNAAHSLRSDRIRVNSLRIGWMATPNEDRVQRGMGEPADWLEQADARMPFGRILRPEEVARSIAFLLGDEAQLMTGSVIDYDQNVIGTWD